VLLAANFLFFYGSINKEAEECSWVDFMWPPGFFSSLTHFQSTLRGEWEGIGITFPVSMQDLLENMEGTVCVGGEGVGYTSEISQVLS